MSDQPKPKHGQITDSTIARIAGNIVGHLVGRYQWPGNEVGFVGYTSDNGDDDPAHAARAVRLARLIAAEVERTRGADPSEWSEDLRVREVV